MKLSDMMANNTKKEFSLPISLNVPQKPPNPNRSSKIFNPFLSDAMGGAPVIIESCHICSSQFSLIKKKQTCKQCQKATCKEHMVVQSINELDRICDHCMHENLLKQRQETDQEIKDQIMDDILRSKEIRESRTQLLHRESAKEKAIRKEIKETYTKHAETEAEILNSLLREQDEKLKLMEVLERVKGRYEATKYTEHATTR